MSRTIKHWRVVAVCGVLGAAAVAVPILATASTTTTTAAPQPDQILYYQQKGGGGSLVKYVPGDGTAATTQSLATGGGGCSSPTPSGPPLLPFSARYYNTSAVYSDPTAWVAASVGAYNLRTGVCAIPQDWSIEVGEALIFGLGQTTTPPIAGRLYVEAAIVVVRNDKTANTSATGNLVVRRQGAVVGTVPYSIAGSSGTTAIADTGRISGGFDEVEIQLDSPPTASISVVGPTLVGNVTSVPTFTFAPQVCAGQTIYTPTMLPGATDPSSVTVTSGCKTYTDFSESPTGGPGGTRAVNFATSGTGTATLTAHLDWGNVPYCVPTPSTSPPTCPPTQVSFSGGPYAPQTFCDKSNPPAAPAWCTWNVQYTFGGGNPPTYTHIVEDWVGHGDPGFYR